MWISLTSVLYVRNSHFYFLCTFVFKELIKRENVYIFLWSKKIIIIQSLIMALKVGSHVPADLNKNMIWIKWSLGTYLHSFAVICEAHVITSGRHPLTIWNLIFTLANCDVMLYLCVMLIFSIRMANDYLGLFRMSKNGGTVCSQ